MDFGLYENELQDIVARADVPVTITNEATNPWTVQSGYIQNGNIGKEKSSSTLSFSYSSEYKTELTFDWACNNYSNHRLYLYIDGAERGTTTNSSYNKLRFYLEPGAHVITLQDTIGNYTYQQYDWSRSKNVCIRSITPLESAVLTNNSLPLTFDNSGTWPWTIEDGYIQNSNYGYKNTASRFSTSFTVTEPSKFSFWSSTYYYDGNNAYDYSGYQYFDFKINGNSHYYACNQILPKISKQFSYRYFRFFY